MKTLLDTTHMNRKNKLYKRRQKLRASRHSRTSAKFSFARLEPRQLLAADFQPQASAIVWSDFSGEKLVDSTPQVTATQSGTEHAVVEDVQCDDETRQAWKKETIARPSSCMDVNTNKVKNLDSLLGDGAIFFSVVGEIGGDDSKGMKDNGNEPALHRTTPGFPSEPTSTPGNPTQASSPPTEDPTPSKSGNEPSTPIGLELGPVSMLAASSLEASGIVDSIQQDPSGDSYFSRSNHDGQLRTKPSSNGRSFQTGMIGRYQSFSVIDSNLGSNAFSMSVWANNQNVAEASSPNASSRIIAQQNYGYYQGSTSLNTDAQRVNFDSFMPSFSEPGRSAFQPTLLLNRVDFVSRASYRAETRSNNDVQTRMDEPQRRAESRIDNVPAESEGYEFTPTYKSHLLLAVVLVANCEDRKRLNTRERNQYSYLVP